MNQCQGSGAGSMTVNACVACHPIGPRACCVSKEDVSYETQLLLRFVLWRWTGVMELAETPSQSVPPSPICTRCSTPGHYILTLYWSCKLLNFWQQKCSSWGISSSRDRNWHLQDLAASNRMSEITVCGRFVYHSHPMHIIYLLLQMCHFTHV